MSVGNDTGLETDPSSDAFSYEAYKASLLAEPETSSSLESQLHNDLDVPLAEVRDLTMLAASRTKRLLGALLDGFLVAIALVVGVAAVFGLVAAGVVQFDAENPSLLNNINALCVMYFPAFALALFQWNMTAVEGQTIAKKLLGMRIVLRNGSSPGFFQGVLLRSWGITLLGMIPFVSLLNILFIFGEPRRCLHDYLAGTYVINS